MRTLRFSILRPSFNLRSVSARGLGLAIEHLPCCLLTVAASMIGIPFLSHNAALELGFAIGGALIGEYVGHKYFFKKSCGDGTHTHSHTARRYAIALAIGLATWGAHQVFLHHDHDSVVTVQRPATPTSAPAR